ncbi:MAG: type II toxin-antitoxin system VapB family antitoxin [Gemmatimonadota bacterium]
MAQAKSGSRREANIRRKNLNIDQTKLDEVRRLLGANTETEAVDQALSLLLLREEVSAGIRRIAGSGGVQNVFEDDREP